VNALLVLGLAIVVGARAGEGGVMSFGSRLPNDTATLLLLSVFIIVLLGLSETVGDRASEHQVAIWVVGAICLLGVYGAWVSGYLGGDTERRPAPKVLVPQILPVRIAVVLLAVAGLAAAFVSSWFVTALGPTADDLGISRAFTGLVLVAVAGTAIPNAIGIALAGRGQADLAISVISNSVAQIAAVVYPASVLASLFFADRLTFVLNPVYIGALVLGAVAVWQITGDGRAMAFEGCRAHLPLRRARGAGVLRVAARSASTSSRESSRHSPSGSRSSVRAAYALRCSRRTGWPTASSIRLTWCVRPSWRTSSTRPRPSRRTRAGAVGPSSSWTPSRSRASAASSGSPSTSATYVFSTP
jgi:MFS family permease